MLTIPVLAGSRTYKKRTATSDWYVDQSLESGCELTASSRYASGLGAGNISHFSCFQYAGSYANLVVQQLRASALAFEDCTCMGEDLAAIKQHAGPLSTGQDFTLVSGVRQAF